MNNLAIVSDFDLERLDKIIGTFNERDVAIKNRLMVKLDQADILDSNEIPPDIVTVNSTVLFRMSNANLPLRMTLTLPSRQPPPEDSISILTPTGIALLGLREGDDTTFTLINGDSVTLWVDEILQQPEREIRKSGRKYPVS
ncbi:MAG: GreA/GreB family elongation factor [Natronospirillum sp.]